MKNRNLFLLFVMILGSAWTTPLAGQNGPRVFVDPVNGDDTNTGQATDDALRTIGQALQLSTPNTNTAIVLLPGVYSPQTNGEIYPLFMQDGVSIQGTNALNTVLDCGGSGTGLSFIQQGGFEGTHYDGFTITNAVIAINIVAETVAASPTFSNLVIVKNHIGIQMVAIDLEGLMVADDIDGNNYVEHRPRLVNLTIADNDIGIFDIANGISSPGGWGEADPAIANCLFDNDLDLSGTDLEDVVARIDRGRLSNVFSTFLSSATRIKADRRSPGTGSLPFIRPAAADFLINRDSFDYRINPDNANTAQIFLVDQGISEEDDNLEYHGGLTVIEPIGDSGQMIWDMDLEGHGNVRLEGEGHDIGADELGEFVVAGYLPQTTSFVQFATGTVWLNPVNGQPASNPVIRAVSERDAASNPYNDLMTMGVPGARPPGTTLPTNFPGINGFGFLSVAGFQFNFFPVSAPVASGVSSGFFVFVLTTPPDCVSNNQYAYYDSAANLFLTNLQSFTILR